MDSNFSIRAAAPALLAALLFGASTPLAKVLGVDASPILLAGLLYLGSGAGLAAVLAVRLITRRAHWRTFAIPAAELPWMLGAVIAGGMLGPALLMTGLATTDAAPAALLLNLEGVFTAVIAWGVFKENADRRIVIGMLAVVLGGVVLSWQPGGASLTPGALLIVGACACWAIDNNLTRKVSNNDAMLIACIKGLLAGTANTALALLGGAARPGAATVSLTLALGFAGYGLSLVLFVVALRRLGAARTGAYFSVAPLFGVAIAFLIWPVVPPWTFWAAAGSMGVGLWLHLRERHEHEHVHESLDHVHRHRHDAHHQHDHDFAWDGREPHVHPHRHRPIEHRHVHFPDMHHRHRHSSD